MNTLVDKYKEEIAVIRLSKQSIIDVGGAIDDQIFEEHKIKLIEQIGALAEKYRIDIRIQREGLVKSARKLTNSEDELARELNEIDKQTKDSNTMIVELCETKIKEIQNA